MLVGVLCAWLIYNSFLKWENMGKSPDISTLHVDAKGLTKATLPRPIAQALDIKTGTKVRWRVTGKDRLECAILRAGKLD